MKIKHIGSAITIAGLFLMTSVVTAQDSGNTKVVPNQSKRQKIQSGTIKLETGAKQKSPTEIGIEAAEKYFTTLQSVLKSNSEGGTSRVQEIDSDTINYITPAYLYCSVNSGVCKYFLDSLLEADVINSRLSKQANCKTLRSFWKQYLSNDLEARHKYATKIGFLAETGEFNTKTRPMYIKCADTVKEEISGDMSDSEFFRKRYADGSKLEAVSKSLEFIQTLKAKNINIFTEVSAMR